MQMTPRRGSSSRESQIEERVVVFSAFLVDIVPSYSEPVGISIPKNVSRDDILLTINV
jgi:hypothetical protein